MIEQSIIPGLMFYMFASVLVLSAIMVIASKNPVHSVLYLILAFFNAAGLFLLLGAEFAAFILIIVYVGAVAVLFLFVVMMLDINFRDLRHGVQSSFSVGLIVGAVLIGQLVYTAANWHSLPGAENNVATSTRNVHIARNDGSKEHLDAFTSNGVNGKADLKENMYGSAPHAANKIMMSGAGSAGNTNNTHAIGNVLYTDYIYPFQVAGLILLVAMIGAITLTLRHRTDTRRQNIDEQITRTRDKVVEIRKVEKGAGI